MTGRTNGKPQYQKTEQLEKQNPDVEEIEDDDEE
jgi:hypothetical protein